VDEAAPHGIRYEAENNRDRAGLVKHCGNQRRINGNDHVGVKLYRLSRHAAQPRKIATSVMMNNPNILAVNPAQIPERLIEDLTKYWTEDIVLCFAVWTQHSE